MFISKSPLPAILCFLASMAVAPSQASADTYLTICNSVSDRPLYIYRAEGNVAGGWWTGEGWYTANRNTCMNTGLTDDNTPVAFAFALPSDSGELVPVEVSVGGNYGRTPIQIDEICAPDELSAFTGRNSSVGRACSENSVLVPVSFIAVTGTTSFNEFDTVTITALPNGEYDLSASDPNWQDQERAVHLRWQGYFESCRAAKLDRYPDFYSGGFAARACACETLAHDYALSQTNLTDSNLTFEYPDPWSSETPRRERYDMGVAVRECSTKNSRISRDFFAPVAEWSARIEALR